MRGAWHAAATLAAIMGPGLALACSVEPFEVTGTPVRAGQCAVALALDPYRAIGLDMVVAHRGDGMVSQWVIDGNACYMSQSLLVQDCRTGAALIIGPDRVGAGAGEPGPTALETLYDRLDAGELDLDGLAEAARAAGYSQVRETSVGVPVGFVDAGGVAFASDCGCREMYGGVGQ